MSRFSFYPIAGLILFILSIVLPAVPVHAANSNVDLDKKRRLVRLAIICADRRDVVDSDDDAEGSSLSDMWDDVVRDGDGGKREIIVAGFEIDSDNGVISCHTALPRGVRAANLSLHGITASSETKAKELLSCHYTELVDSGCDFVSGQKYDVINGGNDRSEALASALRPKLDEFEAPDTQLRVRRFVGLVQACYTGVEDEGAAGSGPGDFTVDGLGSFFRIDGLRSTDFSWLKQNDSLTDQANNRRVEIGDLDLGFFGSRVTSVGDRFDGGSSDFYPIGSDISPPRGEGYRDDSIVDCNFVKDFKNLIFSEPERWSFDDNDVPQYNAPNGQDPIVPGGPGGDDTGDENEPICEEGFDFSFAWLVCAALETVDDWVNNLLGAVSELLAVESSELDNDELETAWSFFRNIASVLLVIIGLVMIIGQAGSKE